MSDAYMPPEPDSLDAVRRRRQREHAAELRALLKQPEETTVSDEWTPPTKERFDQVQAAWTKLLDALNAELAEARAENQFLRGEVEFGIEKALNLTNQMREQAAVHGKRDDILKQSRKAYATQTLNLKATADSLRRVRAERDAELPAVLSPEETQPDA